MRKLSLFVLFAALLGMVSVVGCRLVGDDNNDVAAGGNTNATINGSLGLTSIENALLANVSASVQPGTVATYGKLLANLYNGDGTAIGTATLSDLGVFTFSNVTPGSNYHVEIHNNALTLLLMFYMDTVPTGDLPIIITERTTAIGLIIKKFKTQGKTYTKAQVETQSAPLLDATEAVVKEGIKKALGTTDPAIDIAVAYAAADGINGGQLYDNFWATETGYDQTSTNLTNLNAKADFFRCKQCHGWDLLGNVGAYINRAPKTSRPNVAGSIVAAKSYEPEALFNFIKYGDGATRRKLASFAIDVTTYDPATNNIGGDQMPDYSELLTDSQIWDLVKFMKTEAIDTTQLYTLTTTGAYPTGTKAFSNMGNGGSATAGKAYFATNCARCHGADGTSFKVDGASAFVGAHFRSNPYEDHQKVKYGQLGATMTGFPTVTLQQLKDLYAAMANEVDFPTVVQVAPTGAELYASKCAGCHGALATSTKKGRTATQIQSAITNNTGGMNTLSALTIGEIASISLALQ